MAEQTLGLVMILKNEALNLKKSLAPVVELFDEAVAVDTGSSDGTPGICARMGAKVFPYTWVDDFSAARNFSISKAGSDWLFWLDGDNSITPGEVGALRQAIAGLDGPAVLWAQEMVVPGGARLWQKRCFPRHEKVFFQGRVHEQLSHPGHWPAVCTPVVVRHWGYNDPGHMEQKGLYYLKLLEQMLADDPDDFYAHFQIARCHMNLRQTEKAIEHLDILISDQAARKTNGEIWTHGHVLLAQAWERDGKSEKAGEILDRLIALDPGSGLGHYHRGRLAYGSGRWKQAATDLDRARELGLASPMVDTDQDKIMFLASYFQGRALERLGLLTDAANALAQAAAEPGAAPAARTDLARVLISLGRRDEARGQLHKVLELRPADRGARRLMDQLEKAA